MQTNFAFAFFITFDNVVSQRSKQAVFDVASMVDPSMDDPFAAIINASNVSIYESKAGDGIRTRDN